MPQIVPLSSEYRGYKIQTFACSCKKGLYYWSEFTIGDSNYASELVGSVPESIAVTESHIDRLLESKVTQFRKRKHK